MSNRRTALYDRHVALKARVVPFAGWDMPVQYAGIAAEHKAVRTAAGVFDVSHMARFSISGPDALALLETVFTNSVATLKDGQVRYGLVCNEAGGILDDVLVYRRPHNYAVVVNASNRDKILAWLGRHAAGRAVEVKDHTDETAMLAVQGPAAAGIVRRLVTPDPTTLRYYYAATADYAGFTDCLVSRTGYTGEDGFEVVLPAALSPLLWDALLSAGVVPCGLGARDTLRLEAAMPLYGHELTEAIDPIRAGLGWAVKLDKGDFVGRDALRSVSGPVRVGLELEGTRAAREGSPILSAGAAPAGTVTSGSFAPWLGKSIAMGYVPRELAAPGTRLLVDARGTHLPAVVVPLPFYRRPKETA
jgi:aminomethyltransferase